MTDDTPRTVSRRAVIATAGLVGLGALATPVAAAPPKGTKPTSPDRASVVRKIGHMGVTIGKIQDRLASCDSDVCGTVLEHALERAGLTGEAKAAAKKRNWETTTTKIESVREIVVTDIELLESVEDRGSVGDVLGLERSLLNQTDAALKAVEQRGVMPGDRV